MLAVQGGIIYIQFVRAKAIDVALHDQQMILTASLCKTEVWVGGWSDSTRGQTQSYWP